MESIGAAVRLRIGFPDALLGERPVGAVERLVDLEAAADHADERAHDHPHEETRRAGLELARAWAAITTAVNRSSIRCSTARLASSR